MAIELTDDGTMDTVLYCSDCGEEMRYNYDPEPTDDRTDDDGNPLSDEQAYDDFVDWAIENATDDHECPKAAENDDRLIALGFDRGSRGCSQCQALAINGTPTHERGCPNQTHECKGCNARVSRAGAYCEDCQ